LGSRSLQRESVTTTSRGLGIPGTRCEGAVGSAFWGSDVQSSVQSALAMPAALPMPCSEKRLRDLYGEGARISNLAAYMTPSEPMTGTSDIFARCASYDERAFARVGHGQTELATVTSCELQPAMQEVEANNLNLMRTLRQLRDNINQSMPPYEVGMKASTAAILEPFSLKATDYEPPPMPQSSLLDEDSPTALR